MLRFSGYSLSFVFLSSCFFRNGLPFGLSLFRNALCFVSLCGCLFRSGFLRSGLPFSLSLFRNALRLGP
ncbi:MAG TPA: hypothetical protein PKL97_01285, partial [Candidatus Omnitrophota bacterium]|nr:hypothetical protein [Candidatus Omnitrophota bacterium]